MADKPILFSGPMVRALLAGTKTQTRRLLGSPSAAAREPDWRPSVDENGTWRLEAEGPDVHGSMVITPRIEVGDRLYVREHWYTDAAYNDTAPRDLQPGTIVRYEADGERQVGIDALYPGRFRQGMHMPRWASRLTLTVVDVHVQRLQEISHKDVLAEGCPIDPHFHDTTMDGSGGPMVLIGTAQWQSPRAWYHRLWDSINGDGSWDANPWVAAYTFTVERANIEHARAA